MTKQRWTAAAVGAAAAVALVAPAAIADGERSGGSYGGRDLSIVGLTGDGKLIGFRADAPSRARWTAQVSGLVGDQSLVGVDYRVQDGQLYGVGDAGGVYTVDARRGQATKVSQLTVPLSGTAFGVDFNPAANRLRVVSDTGQNLRHNIDDPAGAPAAGVTANDAPLTYPATPTVPAATAVGISAAAYTNNDLDPTTATTLFDIDAQLDQVVIQSPANAGLVQPTGKLAVDASAPAGFDIASRLRSGATVDNRGLAVLQVDGRSRLYDVSLLTGAVSPRGSFGKGWLVVDLAIPLDQR